LDFATLVLDPAPKTAFARRIYERLGFADIAPYDADPVEETRFLALTL